MTYTNADLAARLENAKVEYRKVRQERDAAVSQLTQAKAQLDVIQRETFEANDRVDHLLDKLAELEWLEGLPDMVLDVVRGVRTTEELTEYVKELTGARV
jgi:chromosome segregation ATPase